jgi:imidazoleglycerol-phosphate dehydratase
LVFDAVFPQEKVGDFDTCLCEEFFRALAFNAGITLHLKNLYGSNAHHMIEALFKSAARALGEATRQTGQGILSTKGVID